VPLVLEFVVALPAGRGSVFRTFLHAFHFYVARSEGAASGLIEKALIDFGVFCFRA
jgi:hypothetical protein